jgi:putative membrane protein
MEAISPTPPNEQLGPPERLHPLYLLTGLGQSVKGAWGLLAGIAVLGSQGKWSLVILIAVGVALVSIVSLLMKWVRFEYRVGAHELRIDSGLLSRTSRAIPFDRVTDVDLEQGPIHRLFGLARVRLETGASAGANDEDGILHTIALSRAEALREHIRARRSGSVGVTQASPEIDAAPLFAMDAKRVGLAGLFNFSLTVIAGLFGLTQTVGEVIGFDPFKRAFWEQLLDRAGPLQAMIMTHQLAAIAAGTLLLILLGVGTGLVRTVLREHGFRLDRTESGLRRRRGLLTLTDVTIPAKRVQAAILATGPIRRRFGWHVLKLQSLAMDGKKGDHVVAPLAQDDEADAILRALDWPLQPHSDAWRPIHRAYVLSLVAILVPASLLTFVALPFIGPIALLWPAGAVLAIAVRWLDWKRARYALGTDALFIETGWLRHRRNILPRRKIQSIDLAESFWDRAFGICSLRLGVAGGGGFSNHHVPALSRTDAEALRSALLTP